VTPDDRPPTDAPEPADGIPPDEPRAIGPYRLLRLLGEGGMGLVYEAEQTEPVRRKVALKIVKLGMDTREFVARFEAERQALAVMSHPNIARIHDGGSTPTGRPYFVMELVHGVPITDYCDAHRLSVQERLELFVAVCSGVHHAHQKGVIHRDLKPSNVLVALEGGRPIPKVIDFGIAKALGHRLTDHTLVTELGRPIGTPEYMSPEQAEASPLDVDTRTDIYSLGVMLYELLVGALPIDVTDRQARGGIMQHMLRELEAPTPSEKYRSLDGWGDAVAERRRTDPGSLLRELRSDLDWIVMRAIEKDRTRRYDSVAALAADIERHMRHEPILARPPTARYRAGRFARRHWAGVAAAAFAALALAAGAAGATVGLVRARAAEQEARREAETARQVADFMVDLFRVSAPGEALGNTITAREILDRGAVDIRARLEGQPAVKARMMAVIGAVYQALGLYDEAEPMLHEALALQRNVLGPGHREIVGTLVELSSLSRLRATPSQALAQAEEALAIAIAAYGPEHAHTAVVHQTLGGIHRELGDYDEARRHFDRAIAIREQLHGPRDYRTADGLAQLAWLNRVLGDFRAAREAYERVIDIAEHELPPGHPDLAAYLSDLGVVLSDLGEYDEARSYYERALAIRENAFGPHHVQVGRSLNNLGALEWSAGDLEAAQARYESALAVHEAALGPRSTEVAMVLGNLGLLRHRLGQYAEARDFYGRSIAIQESVYGPDSPNLANTLNNFGWLLRYIGDFAAAQQVLQRALALGEAALGPDSPHLVGPLTNLTYLFRDQGDFHRARTYAERALALIEATYPATHVAVGAGLAELGSVLVLLDERDEALRLLERARAINPDSHDAVVSLAALQHRRGDHPAADSLFALWIEIMARWSEPRSAGHSFNEAVAWALRDDRERAVDRLRTAVDRGYSDPWLTRHYAFIGLRNDPRYIELAQEVKRRAGLD
jgi:eukaryotic-like serine/threonine-protein kinase